MIVKVKPQIIEEVEESPASLPLGRGPAAELPDGWQPRFPHGWLRR
jgi:hypothetical protein